MKSIFKTGITIGLILGLAYCTSTSYIPNEQDIKYVRKKWPETDSAALFRGYQLYKTKCTGCHHLYKPTKFTTTEWSNSLYDMRFEADMSKMEYQLIEKYLLTLCCAPDTTKTSEK